MTDYPYLTTPIELVLDFSWSVKVNGRAHSLTQWYLHITRPCHPLLTWPTKLIHQLYWEAYVYLFIRVSGGNLSNTLVTYPLYIKYIMLPQHGIFFFLGRIFLHEDNIGMGNILLLLTVIKDVLCLIFVLYSAYIMNKSEEDFDP